jgi:hypothetical protein
MVDRPSRWHRLEEAGAIILIILALIVTLFG